MYVTCDICIRMCTDNHFHVWKVRVAKAKAMCRRLGMLESEQHTVQLLDFRTFTLAFRAGNHDEVDGTHGASC